jgi:DNA-binding MarR family transcriptional regulator
MQMPSKTEDSSHSKSHLQFLNLLKTVRSLPEFPDLDLREEQLLNLLAMTWHANEQITVLKAMVICSDMSNTTAHRRLKSLRLKGIIALVSDKADTRIKYVMPTKKAHQYFAQIGRCMDEAKRG